MISWNIYSEQQWRFEGRTCSQYSVIFALGKDYDSLPFSVHLRQRLCLPGDLFNVFSLLGERKKILVTAHWSGGNFISRSKIYFLTARYKIDFTVSRGRFLKGGILHSPKGLCSTMRSLFLILIMIVQLFQPLQSQQRNYRAFINEQLVGFFAADWILTIPIIKLKIKLI